MSQEHPPERREPGTLNWFGKTVYFGGALLRHTANLIDATTERVSKIAADSKREFERELDPNIQDARIIEEYPRRDDEGEA